VRKSLADMCVDVAAKVGPEAVAQHMSDLVMKCLEDEDPCVKLRVLMKVTVLASDVPTLLVRLTPTLKSLFKDDSWRVRRQICLSMPAIMKSMGNDFFVENFLDDFQSAFKDSVAEVRVSTGECLADMCMSSSPSWVYDRVFPTVKAMASDEYAYRVGMLHALRTLLSADLTDRFQGEVVGLLLAAAADVVANVRLTVAIILGEACRKITGTNSNAMIAQIKPVLQELEGDKDKDVKYFAQEALKNC
ncbi:Ppp2r1b, partial [Symbiodinium microadriaticum]